MIQLHFSAGEGAETVWHMMESKFIFTFVAGR